MLSDTEADMYEAVAARTGLAVQDAWHKRLEDILGALDTAARQARLSVSSYLDQSAIDQPVWRRILSAVTIGETRFLRQKSWFAQVERLALMPLINLRRRENTLKLSLWSAGCSTGEEAYTLAMLLRKSLPDIDAWDIDIHATDIREGAIEAARRGEYDRRQLRELEDRDILQFFAPASPALLAVSPALRGMVGFHVENLADHAGFTVPTRKFDLILCRNVLMYLKPDMQRSVATYLTRALRNGGWLAVSPAEASAEWFKPLLPVNAPEAIFFVKRPAPSPDKPRNVEPVEPIANEPIRAAAPKLTPAAPMDAKAAFDELRLLADRGDLAEARARCQSLLATDGLDNDATILLAEICSELNDAPAAYEAAKRAVYLSPSSSHAHMLLAGALSRLGHGVRARKSWVTATRLARTETSRSAADSDSRQAGAGLPDGRDDTCQV
jgi:chemotaxis protein methyltransferase CheR